jgi:hypothetical protein
MLLPRTSFKTKGIHFQDVYKWCGECTKPYHMNVAYRGFVKCLDHVECVDGWTIMACHVYDLAYCKVMIVAICDM